MSSASAILTALSDLTNNPKLERYDPHLCRDIHIKLDKEALEQGLSYEDRFEMVCQTNLYTFPFVQFRISVYRHEKI